MLNYEQMVSAQDTGLVDDKKAKLTERLQQKQRKLGVIRDDADSGTIDGVEWRLQGADAPEIYHDMTVDYDQNNDSVGWGSGLTTDSLKNERKKDYEVYNRLHPENTQAQNVQLVDWQADAYKIARENGQDLGLAIEKARTAGLMDDQAATTFDIYRMGDRATEWAEADQLVNTGSGIDDVLSYDTGEKGVFKRNLIDNPKLVKRGLDAGMYVPGSTEYDSYDKQLDATEMAKYKGAGLYDSAVGTQVMDAIRDVSYSQNRYDKVRRLTQTEAGIGNGIRGIGKIGAETAFQIADMAAEAGQWLGNKTGIDALSSDGEGLWTKYQMDKGAAKLTGYNADPMNEAMGELTTEFSKWRKGEDSDLWGSVKELAVSPEAAGQIVGFMLSLALPGAAAKKLVQVKNGVTAAAKAAVVADKAGKLSMAEAIAIEEAKKGIGYKLLVGGSADLGIVNYAKQGTEDAAKEYKSLYNEEMSAARRAATFGLYMVSGKIDKWADLAVFKGKDAASMAVQKLFKDSGEIAQVSAIRQLATKLGKPASTLAAAMGFEGAQEVLQEGIETVAAQYNTEAGVGVTDVLTKEENIDKLGVAGIAGAVGGGQLKVMGSPGAVVSTAADITGGTLKGIYSAVSAVIPKKEKEVESEAKTAARKSVDEIVRGRKTPTVGKPKATTDEEVSEKPQTIIDGKTKVLFDNLQGGTIVGTPIKENEERIVYETVDPETGDTEQIVVNKDGTVETGGGKRTVVNGNTTEISTKEYTLLGNVKEETNEEDDTEFEEYKAIILDGGEVTENIDWSKLKEYGSKLTKRLDDAIELFGDNPEAAEELAVAKQVRDGIVATIDNKVALTAEDIAAIDGISGKSLLIKKILGSHKNVQKLTEEQAETIANAEGIDADTSRLFKAMAKAKKMAKDSEYAEILETTKDMTSDEGDNKNMTNYIDDMAVAKTPEEREAVYEQFTQWLTHAQHKFVQLREGYEQLEPGGTFDQMTRPDGGILKQGIRTRVSPKKALIELEQVATNRGKSSEMKFDRFGGEDVYNELQSGLEKKSKLWDEVEEINREIETTRNSLSKKEIDPEYEKELEEKLNTQIETRDVLNDKIVGINAELEAIDSPYDNAYVRKGTDATKADSAVLINQMVPEIKALQEVDSILREMVGKTGGTKVQTDIKVKKVVIPEDKAAEQAANAQRVKTDKKNEKVIKKSLAQNEQLMEDRAEKLVGKAKDTEVGSTRAILRGLIIAAGKAGYHVVKEATPRNVLDEIKTTYGSVAQITLDSTATPEEQARTIVAIVGKSMIADVVKKGGTTTAETLQMVVAGIQDIDTTIGRGKNARVMTAIAEIQKAMSEGGAEEKAMQALLVMVGDSSVRSTVFKALGNKEKSEKKYAGIRGRVKKLIADVVATIRNVPKVVQAIIRGDKSELMDKKNYEEMLDVLDRAMNPSKVKIKVEKVVTPTARGKELLEKFVMEAGLHTDEIIDDIRDAMEQGRKDGKPTVGTVRKLMSAVMDGTKLSGKTLTDAELLVSELENSEEIGNWVDRKQGKILKNDAVAKVYTELYRWLESIQEESSRALRSKLSVSNTELVGMVKAIRDVTIYGETNPKIVAIASKAKALWKKQNKKEEIVTLKDKVEVYSKGNILRVDGKLVKILTVAPEGDRVRVEYTTGNTDSITIAKHVISKVDQKFKVGDTLQMEGEIVTVDSYNWQRDSYTLDGVEVLSEEMPKEGVQEESGIIMDTKAQELIDRARECAK